MGRVVVILIASVSLCFHVFIVTAHNRKTIAILQSNDLFSWELNQVQKSIVPKPTISTGKVDGGGTVF